MPNTNQTLFILIFCLLAVVLILLTYVLWLRRMKRRAKEELLAEEHRMESANHPFNSSISPEKLQQLKPVLLQKLYGKDIDRRRNDQSNPLNNNVNNRDDLININDASERDATIIPLRPH